MPEIKYTGNFIEVIGHYDNEILCAKMTLLADLYAVEHRDGYAKFRVEDEGKLALVTEGLKFPVPMPEPEPGGEPEPITAFWVDFYQDGVLLNHFQSGYVDMSLWNNPDSLWVIYHNHNIYGVVGQYGIESDLPTSFIADPTTGTLILSNVNPEFTGSFFSNPQNNTLVEGEPVCAGYYADYAVYFTTRTGVSIDLTTLSGWSSLSDGTYAITVKASADGYVDSSSSTAVSVTKAAAGETWVINLVPDVMTPMGDNYNITFTSNNVTYHHLFFGLTAPETIEYDSALEAIDCDPTVAFDGMYGIWTQDEYKTITFETAPTGGLLAWLQENAVKQGSEPTPPESSPYPY